MSDTATSSSGVLPETPGAAALTTWGAGIAGAVAILVGGFWLTAWLGGFAAPWSAAGAITVKTNMALCLLLAGFALWLLAGGGTPPLQLRRVAGAALALVVLVIAALTLSEHLFGWDVGIDQWLATEAPGAAATASPNRMGPPGSLSHFLLGVGLLALAWGRRALAPYLGLAACLVNLLPIVGYLYAIENFYRQPLTGIAWPTVVALFSLGMGLVLVVREAGPMRLLLREDAGGALLRRLLPLTLLIPLALGFLRIQAEDLGWSDAETRTGLLIVALLVIFSAMLWRAAAQLSRSAAAETEAQRAVRASEERFRVAQELSPDGFSIMRPVRDPEGRVVDFTWVYANAATERIVDMKLAALAGRSMLELFPGHAGSPFLEAYRQVAETGQTRDLESLYQGDGVLAQRWFRLAVISMGQDIAVLSQDITARKQTDEDLRVSEARLREANAELLYRIAQEETANATLREARRAAVNLMKDAVAARSVAEQAGAALRASEGRLRLAVEAADFGTWDLDLVTGKAVRSLRHDQIFGYREPQLEWSLDIALRHILPEDRQKVQDAHTPAPGKDVMYVEARIRRADGSMGWVMSTGRFHYDAQGRALRVIGVCADISERKQSEEALRESEERFRLMGDAIPYGAWMADADGGNIYISPLFLELVGMTFAQVKEFGWTGKMPPEDVEPTLRRWTECVRTGRDWEGELRFPSPDGRWHTILSRGRPVRDAQGKIKAWVGINLDITERKQAEEQVRQAAAFDEAAMRSLGEGLYAIDEKGLVSYVNPAAEELFGWSFAELRGKKMHDLTHHHYRDGRPFPSSECAGFQVLTTGVPLKNHEDVFIRKDGTFFDVNYSIAPMRDTTGKIVGLVVVFSDITERKQAEAALRQSREDLERAQAVGQVGSWRLDTRRNILTWSEENHRIFGLPKGTPLSYETFLSTIHPDDREYVDTQWQAGTRGAPYDIEHRIIVDGQVKWVREKAYLEFDETGALRGGLGITQDITKRKRAEDATRASEARFSAIIRTAMDAIITLDQDQRIILFNASAEQIFRCSAAEAIGQSLDRFIPERYRESHRTYIENFGKSGVMARAMGSQKRLVGQRADGELFPFEATMSQADTAGQKLYTVILRDISEREKAEQSLRKAEAERVRAEQSNDAKAAFLANISHELRTPLNAILGFSRLVRNAPGVPAGQIRNLDIVNRSGEHLLNLINNVLEMSRIESGHMELKEVVSDLGQVLQEVQSLLQAQAAKKGLVLIAQGIPVLPRQVGVDADKLRQVLINLAANAIKFSARGSVVLRAKVTRQNLPQTAWVRFEVEDAGHGISEEDRKRIFSPFVQLGEQPRTDAGTGLGLVISRRYVELMGGQIDVVSEPGKGSVFYFEIPVRVNMESGKDSGYMQHARVVALLPGQPIYRLLIAEDQAENRLLLRLMLEPLGFDLREAKDGQEAMALFEQWRPHLIWMDIGMPKTDGLQVTRQIRASAAGASTKIVAVTAHVFEDERRKILAAGCDGFIRKPYREAEIFEALKDHLGVRFVFADANSPAAARESGEVSQVHLKKLPPALLRQLRDAAVLLDGPRCLEIAATIDENEGDLRGRLQRMVDDLQFSEMLDLLDHAIEMKSA